MKLRNLRIKGLKCYKDSGIIPFHNLSVFIGENDSGKSTALDALEFLLNNKSPRYSVNESDNDFRTDTEFIEITGTFTTKNQPNEIKPFIFNDELKLKKIFSKNNSLKAEVYSEVFKDNKLNTFESMNSKELIELLIRLKIDKKQNQTERKEAVRKYINESPNLDKIPTWKEVKMNEISSFLPDFHRYSSSDYGNPENLIRKTLEDVYRAWFYEKDNEGNESLRADFTTLKTDILIDINEKLETKLLNHIKIHTPEIANIVARCDIDFAKGLSFSGLSIKEKLGSEKSLNQIGEGSKKKIFLSILEWDSEINLSLDPPRNIIRGYDEPDANLHYDAQRKMFYVINDLVQNKNLNIQAIICTHSLTMIDRAPAKCINHIIRNEIKEESIIEYLESENDEDINVFLNQISEISGIKNSSIFYEKCFLLVEGQSEQNALPVIYKKHTGRSMSEDGIILINLETNGQWNNALKFLHSKKAKCTVLLLDSDTQLKNSTNKVTKEKLARVGFDSSFLKDHCFFIGDKEFEDVITDDQYVRIYNEKFPKNDNSEWIKNNFSNIRNDKKFSNSLKTLLIEQKQNLGKPEIASATAEVLTKKEIENILVLKNLFSKIKEIIQ